MNLNNILWFLCVKITNKGNWIIVNSIYDQLTLSLPILTFEYLTKFDGWNNLFMMVEFEPFIKNNKKILFSIKKNVEIFEK